MTAPHIPRRRFLGTLSFLFGSSLLRAGGILISTPEIKWLGGVVLPRPLSPSFPSARNNLLVMLESNLSSFTGNQDSFEYVSDLANGTTIIGFLTSKGIPFTIQQQTLGSFLRSLNGKSNNPDQSLWWKFKINGKFVSSSIDKTTLNNGDRLSFVLGTDLNDSVKITDSFGDYSAVLISDSLSLWNGSIQSDAFSPRESGGEWHECCKITLSNGDYFIPQEIVCTRHIEVWTSAGWQIVSSKPVLVMADSDFIGKSWNESQETGFDQASNRMIFASTGVGFPAMPGTGPEVNRLGARLTWLRDNRVRVRTALSIPIRKADGITRVITSEKFVLKDAKSAEGRQPLTIIGNTVHLETSNSGDLTEVETSTDLKNWTSHDFTDQNSAQFPAPPGSKGFFRTRRFE